ncbi:MAG: hypothetical protein QM756_07935 [Polyangiaceae bacterium]
MTEPISSSSPYDPSSFRCNTDDEPEPPLVAGPPPPPPKPAGDAPLECSADPMVERLVLDQEKPARSGVVLSFGMAASAESTTAAVTTPLHQTPGGAAVASGVYLDTERWEVGFYERFEMRWGAGAYAGAGLEGGVTKGRDNFEGAGSAAFAEGGALGKFGVEANTTSLGVAVGLGKGVAAGVAVTETKLEPLLRADQALDWGPNPLTRRGP